MILKISLLLLALFVVYLLVGWYRTFRLHMKLQQLAQEYRMTFRSFVDGEEGWTTIDQGEDSKGCIKIIPQPQVSSMYYYYIKYTGPIDESQAIRFLINNFTNYIKNRRL